MSPSVPTAEDSGGSPPNQAAIPLQALAIDRDAEVPIGVQLAWAIRTRIDEGTLGAGERLPGLRDLAQALGINANTVRAVYARLEREGLLDSRQGSGTFVAARNDGKPQASSIAARAAEEARQAGVDPREVATALYMHGDSPEAAKDQAGRRSTLRTQIAALEQALVELEVEHTALARRARHEIPTTLAAGKPARLPSTAELEQVKSALLRRLSVMQTSIDAIEQPDDPQAPAAQRASQAKRAPQKPRKAGARGAGTPRSGPAPAGA
jgi:DNA-binding transcriptional regulator YhcF (GntR family)